MLNLCCVRHSIIWAYKVLVYSATVRLTHWCRTALAFCHWLPLWCQGPQLSVSCSSGYWWKFPPLSKSSEEFVELCRLSLLPRSIVCWKITRSLVKTKCFMQCALVVAIGLSIMCGWQNTPGWWCTAFWWMVWSALLVLFFFCTNPKKGKFVVTQPFHVWNRKGEKAKEHEFCSYHQHALEQADHQKWTVEKPHTTIISQVDAHNIKWNHAVLKSIACAVLYWGRQCIALRGGAKDTESPGNPGNFLLCWRFWKLVMTSCNVLRTCFHRHKMNWSWWWGSTWSCRVYLKIWLLHRSTLSLLRWYYTM